jgi:hypothetical protein
MLPETGMLPVTWQVVEDSGGGLHLFVWHGETIIYAHSGYEHVPGQLAADLRKLSAGANPQKDEWEGCECYLIEQYHALRINLPNGSEIVADENAKYPAVMGEAARKELGCAEIEDS